MEEKVIKLCQSVYQQRKSLADIILQSYIHDKIETQENECYQLYLSLGRTMDLLNEFDLWQLCEKI